MMAEDLSDYSTSKADAILGYNVNLMVLPLIRPQTPILFKIPHWFQKGGKVREGMKK